MKFTLLISLCLVAANLHSYLYNSTSDSAFFYKIKQNLINIKLPQHIITPCSCTRNNNTKQVHTNPRTHQYICIFILSKSHWGLEHTPPRSHKHTNTTPIQTSPQYHTPCCSSPPHQIIANKIDTADCF